LRILKIKLKIICFLTGLIMDYYYIINRRKPTMKNLQIKKTYSIDGIEYSTKEEALKSQASKIVEKFVALGVEEIIKNHVEFTEALRVLSTGDTTGRKHGENLKALKNLLAEEGYDIERNLTKWPLYHITNSDKEVTNILFKGKVYELYEMFLTGGINELLKYKV
jgi:hypothetical protein